MITVAVKALLHLIALNLFLLRKLCLMTRKGEETGMACK